MLVVLSPLLIGESCYISKPIPCCWRHCKDHPSWPSWNLWKNFKNTLKPNEFDDWLNLLITSYHDSMLTSNQSSVKWIEMAGFSIHFLGDLKPPSTSRIIRMSPPPLASLPWPSRPSPYQVVDRAKFFGAAGGPLRTLKPSWKVWPMAKVEVFFHKAGNKIGVSINIRHLWLLIH